MGLLLTTVSSVLLIYGGAFGVDVLVDHYATPDKQSEAPEPTAAPATPLSEQGAAELRG